MGRPLVPMHQRDASNKTALERRVKLLEIRANNSLPAQSGVISPTYSSGNPMVTVGADASETGPYQHLSSYTPAASDAVALVWLAGSWCVIGKLT